MNSPNRYLKAAATLLAVLLLSACGSRMTRPDGAEAVRFKLNELQADGKLARLVPLAVQDAEAAVRAAEVPTRDREQGRHLVLIADRKVDIAWAQAREAWAEDQREVLDDQREAARLAARTREADQARADADMAHAEAMNARDQTDAARSAAERARKETEFARIDADIARNQANSASISSAQSESDAEAARNAAAQARQDAAVARTDADVARTDAEIARGDADAERQRALELQTRIAELNARETDRGLVVTLGDVLFATGRAELIGSAPGHLATLAAFLERYDDRSVVIEGHTDNVGNDAFNIDLSLRRANSVQAFLVQQGVDRGRIIAAGKGESQPVANNNSDTGRQQNRRVEVIIANPATASR